MTRKLVLGLLCVIHLAIACAYLSPLRNRPVWDLPQFYFAGRLVRAGNAAGLYDRSAYTGLIEELRKIDERASKQSVYFNRPAFEALLCLPLAYFSFATVRMIALIGNFGLVGWLVWKMPQWLRAPPGVRAFLFIFMPFLYSVAFGQDTLLLTLLISCGIYLLLQERELPAGVVLALALFKPHLVWTIPVVLAAGRRWKALCAFLATGSILALISFAMVGWRGLSQWVDLLQAPTTDNTPLLMGNARALGLHFGGPVALAAAVGALLCFLIVLKHNSLGDKFAAAILAGLLLSPHTYRQDYSLMAIVALSAVHPLARYLILIPWPYFYTAGNLVPFILLALGCIAGLAAKPLQARLPACMAWYRSCVRLLTPSGHSQTVAYSGREREDGISAPEMGRQIAKPQQD